MDYRSTQGDLPAVLKSPTAILQGPSPDSGLCVPLRFPQPTYNFATLIPLPYRQLAATILNWFFDELTSDQLLKNANAAYGSQWDNRLIAPLAPKHAGSCYLELFHGSTLTFKDIALQMLPQLVSRITQNTQLEKQIVILTAASGDTGTTSIRGLSSQENIQIIVFCPASGVSPVQLRQMLGQPGSNLHAIATKGNFDDAQTSVKHILNNQAFNDRLVRNNSCFSSANSVNIGRFIPRIVYYFAAYGQLVHIGRIQLEGKVNLTVPTDNFGDVLAGYYAKKLGLPINRLLCASNESNMLTDFLKSGKYERRRNFYLTNSPAMDILVSSNLERLLFDLYGESYVTVAKLVKQLVTNSHYQIDSTVLNKLQKQFVAGFATPDEVEAKIKRVYLNDGYVIDPHTAVASHVTHQYQQRSHDTTPTVIVSTVSPYKFPETVYHALTNQKVSQNGLPALQQLHDPLRDQLSAGVQALVDQTPCQEEVINPADMKTLISEILNLK